MSDLTLNDYLALPYHIELVRDRDEGGNQGWVAEVEELPGCISQGTTPQEAVIHVQDAMKAWLSVALEDGDPIPTPRGERYSGKFLLRIPTTLHAELATEASRESVSLNTFAATTLAAAIGWRNKGQPVA